MKRLTTLIVSALSVALILSACGSKGTSSSSNGGNIQLMWWGTQDRTNMTTKVIKQFEKANKEIKVTPQFTGWDGYWSKLSTQTGGGNIPDVIQMDKQYLRNYVKRGTLMDLSKTNIDLSVYDKSSLNTGKVDGKLYAIPTGVNALALFYDPSMLKKAGVSIDPNKPMSWDEYASLAETITKKLPNTYGTQNFAGSIDDLELYARSKGEEFFSEDAKSLKISKSTLTDWFNYWLKLQDEGATPPAEYTASLTDGDIEKSPIVKKDAPFGMFWSNQFGTMEQLANRKLKLALPPGGNENKPYFLKPSMYWSIAKKTKSKKASEKLVSYLLNSKDAVKVMGTDRGVSINSSVREAQQNNANDTDKEVISYVNNVTKLAGSALPVDPTSANNIIDLLTTTAQEVLFKKVTPEKATDQFFTKATSLLKKG
ncbi:ABC transporter substrate-binding protein [Pullulanibacillus camelliae]|nr:ABC transporter substrate-binding protein [Pullulanibacillus camelliae]